MSIKTLTFSILATLLLTTNADAAVGIVKGGANIPSFACSPPDYVSYDPPNNIAGAVYSYYSWDRSHAGTPLDLSDAYLTFDDEFTDRNIADLSDGNVTTRWKAQQNNGATFNANVVWQGSKVPEQQYVMQPGGGMTFRAWDNGAGYLGAWMQSIDQNGCGFSQKYGYYEASSKVPAGTSYFTSWGGPWMSTIARWQNPNVPFAEMDIMELFTGIGNTFASTTAHAWGGANQGFASLWQTFFSDQNNTITTALVDGNFHSRGVDIGPDWVIEYQDGLELARMPTPPVFKHPFYLQYNNGRCIDGGIGFQCNGNLNPNSYPTGVKTTATGLWPETDFTLGSYKVYQRRSYYNANDYLPINYGLPTISLSGTTLTTTNGIWYGSPSYTYAYQWFLDGNPISNQKASTYVIDPANNGHQLSAQVFVTGNGTTRSVITPISFTPALSYTFSTGVLPHSITDGRVATAYYFNSSGVMTLAPTLTARVSYDSFTQSNPGLLVERASTNLLKRSNSINDQSIWTNTGIASYTGGQPDLRGGTSDFVIAGSFVSANIAQSATVVSGSPYSVSTAIKSTLIPSVQAGSYFVGINPDCSQGTSISSPPPPNLQIHKLSAGFCFVGFSYTEISTTDTVKIFTPGTGAVTVDYVQLEPGISPTSYIPTATTTVTRDADVISLWAPTSTSNVKYTFTDNTTFTDPIVSHSSYVIPTSFTQPIKKILVQ